MSEVDEWTGPVVRSKLEPTKQIARSIMRNHRSLIFNRFRREDRLAPRY